MAEDDAARAAIDDAPGLDEADGADHESIAEILAELRDGGESPAPQEAPPPEPAPPAPSGPPPLLSAEPHDVPTPEPQGAEQDEPASTIDGPPASELPSSSEPQQRQAPSPGPRSLPLASAPHALILLHALFLVAFVAMTWLAYQKLAGTLASVGGGPGAQEPAPAAAPAARPAAPAPPAPAGEPVLRLDEGLRYVQALEKADVLFEKEQYREAAAAYRRALAVMPRGWNDGAAAFQLGQCYVQLEDLPKATDAFREAAAASAPDYQPRALYQLGETHMRLGAYRNARDAFYTLLLQRGRYGPEAAELIEKAHYRLADAYWLEAENLADADGGADE